MEYVPARKIKNKRSKKNTGVFPSAKNRRLVEYESLLERDYIYLLEFDEEILNYKEQPFTIHYSYSNRTYKYTPDFLLQRKDKIQLVEIKPFEKLQEIESNDILFSKYKAAANYCRHNGYDEFKIITDKDIHNGNILKNAKFLFSYHKLNVPASAILKIRNELIINGPQQISQLIDNINENKTQDSCYYAYILSMLYHHELISDLTLPISKNSMIKFKFR